MAAQAEYYEEQPPRDIEPGRFAVAIDPTGAAFSVIKMSGS